MPPIREILSIPDTSYAEISPALKLHQFYVERHEVPGDRSIRVVRDDMLFHRGGTKRRTLNRIMPFVEGDVVVYSATPFGYGQVAVADACKTFEKQAIIFTPMLTTESDLTTRAKDLGARVLPVEIGLGDSFDVVVNAAKTYAERDPKSRSLMSSGFDAEHFIQETANVIKHLDLKERVNEVWCVAGSGALTRSLQLAWPEANHHVVKVRNEGSIYGVDCDPGSARVHVAREDFSDPAIDAPPYPSSRNYDAKVWHHVIEHASNDALVWNM